MNLNYAIFRSEPIFTINDLAQIGAHNKRDKKSYKSNSDIDINKSKDNVDLVPLNTKYVSGFYNLTKEYKKEHDTRMLTMRADRKKSFRDMIDSSKSVVADELLMSASNDFFKGMTREEIVDKYHKTLNETEAFLKNFSHFSEIVTDDMSPELKFYINKIKSALEIVRRLPARTAMKKLQDCYLSQISTNPLIKDEVINLMDGFWRTTYLLTTDEIIEKIENEKEKQKAFIKNYENQIENSKQIFDEVAEKLDLLKLAIVRNCKPLRDDKYNCSLEYALFDYVRTNIN